VTTYPTLIHERVALSRCGKNPCVIGRMPSGWAVLGDNQFLPGYCLLLPDPVVFDLTDLDRDARVRFLLDMSLLGEALSAVTGAERMNYEILGNAEPALHAHIWPRRRDEPDEYRRGPVHHYPVDVRRSEEFTLTKHGRLQADIRDRLDLLLGR
jgi:diadenosine tetraphosphate (Ap4A) HIT family hydrolase